MKPTPHHSESRRAFLSDRTLAAIALGGAIGAIACGIVAFPPSQAPDLAEDFTSTHALAGMRPSPVPAGPAFGDTLAAIGQTFSAYLAAIHATRQIGPVSIVVGPATLGPAVSVDVGVFGRAVASIRVAPRGCTSGPLRDGPLHDGLLHERLFNESSDVGLPESVCDAQGHGRRFDAQGNSTLRLVNESSGISSPAMTRKAGPTDCVGGYSSEWPDSARYSMPHGKRVYLDDLPIDDVPISVPRTLAGDGTTVDPSSDA